MKLWLCEPHHLSHLSNGSSNMVTSWAHWGIQGDHVGKGCMLEACVRVPLSPDLVLKGLI